MENKIPNIKLKPGDIFCTTFPGAFVGKAINKIQKIKSTDNQSELSHSGIIIDSNGTTFEAIWTYKQQNIWEAYGGKETKLLIGRHKLMSNVKFIKGITEITSKYKGKVYPIWRLALFMLPYASKYISFGPVVCSELVMRFLFTAGLIKNWKGYTPDDVADMIVRNKMYEVIYFKNITSYDERLLVDY